MLAGSHNSIICLVFVIHFLHGRVSTSHDVRNGEGHDAVVVCHVWLGQHCVDLTCTVRRCTASQSYLGPVLNIATSQASIYLDLLPSTHNYTQVTTTILHSYIVYSTVEEVGPQLCCIPANTRCLHSCYTLNDFRMKHAY